MAFVCNKIKKDDSAIERDELIQHLHEHGIGTSVHFIPLHIHPYYKKRYGYSHYDLPNAYNAYQTSISLPLYPKMTFSDIDHVSDIMHKFFAKSYSKIVKNILEGEYIEKNL